MAKNDYVIVMDADLQHEPEAVPDLAGPLLDGTATFVMGSRNVDGTYLFFDENSLKSKYCFRI